MGVKYSAADSSQLIQAMTSNLQVANQVTDRLSSGCDHLIASLDSGELQGAAYTAGKGLFTEVIIPAIKKLQEAIDDIQGELSSYKSADSEVAGYGELDLDLLKEQLKIKQEMLEKTQAQLAEYQSLSRRISDGFAGKLADNFSKTIALTEVENQLNIGIREIQEKIDKLEWFVAQVSQYFADSLQVLGLAIQGATQLSQVLVDSEGNYSTDGIDMSWSAKMKAQKIQTVSKKKYLEPKERLIQEASRNMMLSDEGDAYYRSQLKEKLKGKSRSEWDKIVDDYNHTLKIDNEGNIIDIFDFRAYKDRHYQKDDNFSVLKNGKYDSAYTRMVNEKYQELIQENFEANSVDLAKGVVEILAGLGIYAGTSLGAAFALEWAPLTGGGSALVAAAAVEAGYITAEGLVVDGTLSVARTLYEIDTANLGVTLSAASNYNSWQANRPTSRTISGKGGKQIEARVGNRKVNLRVDWEPSSGTNGDGVFQVQSGSGKSGYGVNEHIDIGKISDRNSVMNWVNKTRRLKNLNESVKNEIVDRIWKTYQNNY
ncbi:virulence protein [Streptococcus sanguinis]|uniref:Virulence protein n=1 Tax=Streptococcus sanguinis TaxID=1305 RepID=A0A7H8UXN3_STRSA|nr:virulence protein [Streptococcus sanguinis]QLB49156.1 virulence protein [Streptococcus sanguinis]